MKTIIQLKTILLIAVLAIAFAIFDFCKPGHEAVQASAAVAAAMLFSAANLSAWRQRVDAFIQSKGLNPANYPIEFRRLVAEVVVTQNSIFKFFLKEDANAAKNREIRLGLNDAFFGFAGRFAVLDETISAPFSSVPATSAITATHNVFYETGTFSLGSGNVEVWSKHPVSQYKYNPNSQTAITDMDGAALTYPSPVLSGRNDLRFTLEIATPGTITHATPATNQYILQFSFFGFNVTGLGKDIETSAF